MKHFFAKFALSDALGRRGEDQAERFLRRIGYRIVGRNVTNPFGRRLGEIDIVAEKGNKLYFVEVKSVSCASLPGSDGQVTLPGKEGDGYRPEENMHPKKLERLFRTIETYVLERKIGDKEWQLDLLCVFLNMADRTARVRMIENIVC